MIQIVVALFVAAWFFRSARAAGRSAVGWAFLGVLALVLPSIPWSIFARMVIFPALLEADVEGAVLFLSALLVGLIGVGLGVLTARSLHRSQFGSPAARQTGSAS
jgi:hypothetical protein